MNELIIADIGIRTDESGRFCLNDLHRASGGEGRHRPSLWAENQQTIDLAQEVSKAGIPAILTKQGLGTYVAKELVYAYAMWISAAFHLKVIRAYDALVTQPAAQPQRPVLPDFTNPVIAARAWADAKEGEQQAIEQRDRLALDNQVQAAALAQAAPQIKALERISAARHAITLTETMKVLSLKMVDMTARMHAEKWIYRINGSWVGYDHHIKNGDLLYKEAKYTDDKTGQEVIKPYCHVTQQGLVKLALMFGVQLPAGVSEAGRLAA